MEEKFDVTGMTCAACQANVTRVVSKLDGVSHCDVSLLSNSMKVEFDQDKVNEQTICEAVKQIGYGASVHGQKTEVRKEWQNRQNRVESDQRSAKQRLTLSLVLLVPLLLMAMGPMVGLPILEGMEWMMVSALTQLILCLFILFIQRHFFITGFKVQALCMAWSVFIRWPIILVCRIWKWPIWQCTLYTLSRPQQL